MIELFPVPSTGPQRRRMLRRAIASHAAALAGSLRAEVSATPGPNPRLRLVADLASVLSQWASSRL